MVTDAFSSILQEVGTLLKIRDLHPDENNTCLLKFKNGLQVQIELDRGGEYLIIGTDLGAVSSGAYRDNLFKEALKVNGLPYPHYGTLAYSRKSDHLILFERFILREFRAEKLIDFLSYFKEKAMIWKEAIARGDIPLIVSTPTKRPMTMFGLRP